MSITRARAAGDAGDGPLTAASPDGTGRSTSRLPLARWLDGVGRVGLEAGPLSQWLYDGLHEAGLGLVLLETRHVKAALSAMAVKTDPRDARGISPKNFRIMA